MRHFQPSFSPPSCSSGERLRLVELRRGATLHKLIYLRVAQCINPTAFLEEIFPTIPLLILLNELLLFVIKFAIPGGFESLLLRCKQLYTLELHLIPVHNKLKNCTRTNYSDSSGCLAMQHPLKFLQELIEDPRSESSIKASVPCEGTCAEGFTQDL